VVVRSKARKVFGRSDTGIVSSNDIRDIISPPFSVFLVSHRLEAV
jgi:hypothetical protein